MAKKVLDLISSCGGCPHKSYYSGGVSKCALVDERILDQTIVAPFCPLGDYPSHTIASMQMTIDALSKPNQYSLGYALLAHLASKLNLTIEPSGRGITIPYKDMESHKKVYFDLDFIKEVSVFHRTITFMGGDENKIFRLCPDSDPPRLEEAADKEGKLWSHHPLQAA